MSAWEWMLVMGMAVVTFGARYPVLALVSRVGLPPGALNALRYVPPAVLAAIIAPAVFMPAGTLDVGIDNAYLVAGIAAVLVSWWRKNLLLTIGIGMAIFLAWRILF